MSAEPVANGLWAEPPEPQFHDDEGVRAVEKLAVRARNVRALGGYKKGDSSRRQLLEATVRVIAARGYANIGLRDIAEGAGLSHGVIHYYFEDKEDLIVHVVRHCAAVVRDIVRRAYDESRRPTEKVQSVLHMMRAVQRDAAPELRVLVDLTASGLRDARLHAELRRVWEDNRNELGGHLGTTLASANVTSRVSLNVLTRLLMALIAGIAVRDSLEPPGPEDELVVVSLLDAVGESLLQT